MRWTDDAAIRIAGLLTLGLVLSGCLAHQLREPASRHCSEARAVVEFCRSSPSCTGATLRNSHGEEWGVLEELEVTAEQACALRDAVT